MKIVDFPNLPDQGLVADLEMALAKAKTGAYKGGLLIMINSTGHEFDWYVSNMRPTEICGHMEVVKHQVLSGD